MHNVKENVKQLLMPWKRKLAEAGGEELQNHDDFGTHPVLQVRKLCLSTLPCLVVHTAISLQDVFKCMELYNLLRV